MLRWNYQCSDGDVLKDLLWDTRLLKEKPRIELKGEEELCVYKGGLWCNDALHVYLMSSLSPPPLFCSSPHSPHIWSMSPLSWNLFAFPYALNQPLSHLLPPVLGHPPTGAGNHNMTFLTTDKVMSRYANDDNPLPILLSILHRQRENPWRVLYKWGM